MAESARRLNRRGFLRAAGGAIMAAAAAGAAGARLARASENAKPNFVIVFTDDQGYADVGCFGATGFKTPNLDRMAAEGMKFTDFYVAGPVCSPSRAALMTGAYPKRTGITGVLFPRDNKGLPAGWKTMADVLKARGYATACIGKWHLGHQTEHLPTSHGFDYYFGIPYSNDMKPTPLMRNTETVEEPAVQATLTRRYTEEAVRFITEHKDEPFLVYLPHTMPHVPLAAGDDFRGKTERGLYGDVIEEIDWSVGRVLEALKRLGLDEKTLVVFTSDNGPWLSKKEHGGSAKPLRAGKGTTYEGGMREPCIMRWPGRIPAGSVCGEMALSMDLMPTLAALAGTEAPKEIDGKDIRALLFAQPGARTPHEAFFYWRGNNAEAVRSGSWKFILNLPLGQGAEKKDRPPELYDLSKDIGESNNVAAGNPEAVQRLKGMLEAHAQALGGKAGRSGPGTPM